ncbi:hypothetical protein WICPIJ_001676 [Wickerhamomyces pijperi]|uniref:Uncharacterized protein n=1 Tax=Wickerhamomyces pijperi TaxID=599730 RepID=A0A9P8QAC8_WICPI|nr:hypothetical protein WICPIJ_001676 [Wickerhamomyces pijperi]
MIWDHNFETELTKILPVEDSETRPDLSKAVFKSSIKSSASSIPIHNLIKSSGRFLSFLVFSSIEACDILQGIEIKELTQPKDTVTPKIFVPSVIISDFLIEPVSKDKTAPNPLLKDLWSSYCGWDFKPG